jgi:hypothetical protein
LFPCSWSQMAAIAENAAPYPLQHLVNLVTFIYL